MCRNSALSWKRRREKGEKVCGLCKSTKFITSPPQINFKALMGRPTLPAKKQSSAAIINNPQQKKCFNYLLKSIAQCSPPSFRCVLSSKGHDSLPSRTSLSHFSHVCYSYCWQVLPWYHKDQCCLLLFSKLQIKNFIFHLKDVSLPHSCRKATKNILNSLRRSKKKDHTKIFHLKTNDPVISCNFNSWFLSTWRQNSTLQMKGRPRHELI